MYKGSFTFALVLCFVIASAGEIWRENRSVLPYYNLQGKNILMVVGHDYDHHEVFDIKALWEDWGAQVHIGAPETVTQGHTVAFNGRWFDSELDSEVKSDVLLKDVSLNKYDALYFPGGKGPGYLVENYPDHIHRILDEAIHKNIPIGAICGGPLVLTQHTSFKGKTLTVSPSYSDALKEFGADYILAEVVVSDMLITGNWPFFETFAIALAHKIIFPDDTFVDIFPFSEECPFCDFLKSQKDTHVFEDDLPGDDILEKVIRSGLSIPWINFRQQEWQFIVVKDLELRHQIADVMLEYAFENEMYGGAPEDQVRNYWAQILGKPALILGFHKPGAIGAESHINHMKQSIIAAGSQMTLAAASMGLGYKWIPALYLIEEQIFEILEPDEELSLVFALSVGYPKRQALPSVRKPMEKVVTFM